MKKNVNTYADQQKRDQFESIVQDFTQHLRELTGIPSLHGRNIKIYINDAPLEIMRAKVESLDGMRCDFGVFHNATIQLTQASEDGSYTVSHTDNKVVNLDRSTQ